MTFVILYVKMSSKINKHNKTVKKLIVKFIFDVK